MNLAAVVSANASTFADKPAIRFHDQTIVYADLWRHIEGVAAFLYDAGIARGDRVGLAMRDHPLHVIAHYAVARLGAVIVPIDHRWTTPEQQSAAQAFAAAVVVTDGDAIDNVPTLTLNEAALAQPADRLPAIDAADTDLLISLSSGTTGKPKGALVTHRNFYERFRAQWQAIGYGVDDCFALLTPLYFGAGRSFAMSILAAGGTLRLAPPPLQPSEIIKVLQDPAVSATFLPPTLLRRLLALHTNGQPPLLANIDYLLVSGEPLFADEALLCLEKLCPNLYSYYASSEGGGISLLQPRDFSQFADTVGLPMPNTDVEVVDAEDNVVPGGEVGRLRYRGPGVATRYLDGDGNERNADSGGWFYPGDLARTLASGHIALCGRDKDVIIRGGINIYPAEIESTLLAHADVVEAAVIGRADNARGQVVVAFIACRSGLDARSIEAWCRARLAPYKVPEEFKILDTLPKRTSGKVDRQALLSSG